MKNNKLYLYHLLECMERIKLYSSSGENEFAKSTLIQDAVIRNLEIIGEATKNISIEFRQQHLEIPWREMAGLRDVLIHDYMGVDVKIVWNVIKNELPKVEEQIRLLIKSYKD